MLTDTATNEGEHERGISGDLRGDLEFCAEDMSFGFGLGSVAWWNIPRSAVAREKIMSVCLLSI